MGGGCPAREPARILVPKAFGQGEKSGAADASPALFSDGRPAGRASGPHGSPGHRRPALFPAFAGMDRALALLEGRAVRTGISAWELLTLSMERDAPA